MGVGAGRRVIGGSKAEGERIVARKGLEEGGCGWIK